ncbi:periplasmic protein involved in polysaccharide export [gamma proteobacterium HIMB55]|nr:periplasmic protein involved in polysaccharide export [gamma proteobacterium HIMB55]
MIRNLIKRVIQLCTFILTLFYAPALFAQALPAGVTPQMAQQLQNMSPAQQQALAKQFGIELPGSSYATSGAGDSSLGEVGQQLEQMGMSEEEYIEGELEEVAQEGAATQLLERYGVSLFDRDVSTFAPTDDALVPDEYRLGVGDQLVVQLFGKENATYTLAVGRDGSINFPKLGAITITGLTFEDARNLIDTRVSQQLIGVEAVMTLGRLRAIGVFMAGEVRVPGAYSVSALTTVTQALFQAGGVTDIGSLRNIQVRRAGKIVTTFDVYDLLMRGDPSGDIRLQSGDVLFVPTIKSVVEIRGEVRRPMGYELVGDETVADLIKMAGGFTKEAFAELAVLVRTSLEGGLPTAKSVNLLESKIASLSLRDGDILQVPTTGDTLANGVSVKGAVYRPGSFGWKPGMRVSDLIGNAERDLLPTADLTYSLIVRVKNELLDIEVSQFSLIDSLLQPGSDKDPLLNVRDQILVFAVPDLEEVAASEFARQTLLAPVLQKLRLQAREGEPTLAATISGAVKAPGQYPILEDYGVDDMVRAAGGLLESADLGTAELRRTVTSASGAIYYRYIDVNFDSSGEVTTDTQLQSRDIVTVREIPDWNREDTISVRGAVLFPGKYVISPGETISSVIERAGGLTDLAFPEGAIFNRVVIARREAERAQAFAADIRQTYASRLLTEETTSTGLQEVLLITEQLETFEGQGRLLIDLPAALSGAAESDYEVEDGDELIIPRSSDTVSVVGEVRQPATHIFRAGLSVEDYISLSAGVTPRSDESAIYIVRANGSVLTLDSSWWRFSEAGTQALRRGDSIVVPVDSQHKESLAQWREVTQIIYQGMVSVAALANL